MRADSSRWHEISPSEFDHEKEGLAHLRELLPDRRPLAREHFDQLRADPSMQGPNGGVRFSYSTVSRYLTNTTFTDLTRDGWIGSRGSGSEQVEEQIQLSLDRGREVVLGALAGPDAGQAARTAKRRRSASGR